MIHARTFSLVITAAGALWTLNAATAQQVSLEQAWQQCLQYVDQIAPRSGSGENDTQRTAQFKACMAKLNIRQ